MKLKFSRITIGFTLAGLVFAVISVLLSLVYWIASPTLSAAISAVADGFFYLCPASFGEIAFDHASTSDYVFLYAFELISNSILYFLIGIVVSTIWRLCLRFVQHGDPAAP